jgi:hypothetical protein
MVVGNRYTRNHGLAELKPGSIVEVGGLKNAPQYNSHRGIVLGISKFDQSGNIRYPIRLFQHSHGGKSFVVRAIICPRAVI